MPNNLKVEKYLQTFGPKMSSASNGDLLDEDADNILEGTLALIKPDAVDRAKDIINIIISEGFLIVEKKKFRFTREVNIKGQ